MPAILAVRCFPQLRNLWAPGLQSGALEHSWSCTNATHCSDGFPGSKYIICRRMPRMRRIARSFSQPTAFLSRSTRFARIIRWCFPIQKPAQLRPRINALTRRVVLSQSHEYNSMCWKCSHFCINRSFPRIKNGASGSDLHWLHRSFTAGFRIFFFVVDILSSNSQ